MCGISRTHMLQSSFVSFQVWDTFFFHKENLLYCIHFLLSSRHSLWLINLYTWLQKSSEPLKKFCHPLHFSHVNVDGKRGLASYPDCTDFQKQEWNWTRAPDFPLGISPTHHAAHLYKNYTTLYAFCKFFFFLDFRHFYFC